MKIHDVDSLEDITDSVVVIVVVVDVVDSVIDVDHYVVEALLLLLHF